MNSSAPGIMLPSWMRTPSMSVSQVVAGLRSFTFQLLPGRLERPDGLAKDTLRVACCFGPHHLVSMRGYTRGRSNAGTVQPLDRTAEGLGSVTRPAPRRTVKLGA